MASDTPVYDIIGDVHGQQDFLESLLAELGYQQDAKGWHQAGHQAIFVGDLIDKGPDPAGVLRLVHAMVTRDAARMVIGNHELNWINHAADYSDSDEDFWRATNRHHDRKRLSAAFADNPEELIGIFNWLRRQPLFIEIPHVMRVVHACWNDAAIEQLRAWRIDCLDDDALAGYRDRYSDVHLALDLIVAGCQHKFPHGRRGDVGFRSHRSRVQWWPGVAPSVHPNEILPEPMTAPRYDRAAPSVFFGHYALTGRPEPLLSNVACVDFAAAWGKPLVAYRHRAGQALSKDAFARISE